MARAGYFSCGVVGVFAFLRSDTALGVWYRRFGTTYRFHHKVTWSKQFLTLTDGTNTLSWNVDNKLPTLCNVLEEKTDVHYLICQSVPVTCTFNSARKSHQSAFISWPIDILCIQTCNHEQLIQTTAFIEQIPSCEANGYSPIMKFLPLLNIKV